MAKKDNKRSFWDKLRAKYRLVIMAQDTFEEKFSFNLSRLNVFIVFGVLSIILVFITIVIIAFTGLREYIPGYSTDYQIRDELTELAYKVDSLTKDIDSKEIYLTNIRKVLTGDPSLFEIPEEQAKESRSYDTLKNYSSAEDSLLRMEVEKMEQYAVIQTEAQSMYSGIKDYFFFTPVKGTIINGFNPRERHFGVDIAAQENSAIKATLDGSVIIAGWTIETGYIVAIQHSTDLISVYRHNSALMKKEGDYVRAGEVIAIIGNTGENTTGPHLHFELWYKGGPVNPANYISFR